MEQIEILCTELSESHATVLRIRGPLTLQTLFDFQNAVRRPGIHNTIIDLTEVPFIDSAGLGSLLSHWAHTQRTGDKFAIAGVCARVQVLFDLTKVNTLLPCFATAEDAERNFLNGSGAASAVSV